MSLPDERTRLKKLFDGARALPPDARPAFLAGSLPRRPGVAAGGRAVIGVARGGGGRPGDADDARRRHREGDHAGRAATRRVPDRAADRRGGHGRGVSRHRSATESSGRDQASAVRAGGFISAPPLPARSEDGVGPQSSAHPHRARGWGIRRSPVSGHRVRRWRHAQGLGPARAALVTSDRGPAGRGGRRAGGGARGRHSAPRHQT